MVLCSDCSFVFSLHLRPRPKNNSLAYPVMNTLKGHSDRALKTSDYPTKD